jgi:hypothetical protein
MEINKYFISLPKEVKVNIQGDFINRNLHLAPSVGNRFFDLPSVV